VLSGLNVIRLGSRIGISPAPHPFVCPNLHLIVIDPAYVVTRVTAMRAIWTGDHAKTRQWRLMDGASSDSML
jgi:hypothetical protein